LTLKGQFESNERRETIRIRITLEPIRREVSFPSHYNFTLQGFIYEHLSAKIATELHDKGYVYGKRHFKLFTFSRILGKYKIQGNNINYIGPVYIWIASPLTELLESFATNFVKKEKVKLGQQFFRPTAVEVWGLRRITGPITVKTLSPITVYSTLQTETGKKKTYYYSPFEKDFDELVKKNLIKKVSLLNNGPPQLERAKFSIKPIKVSTKNEHIINYKGTIIKAWSGIYEIDGSEELLQVAFDAGLGSKNSQGFGMIEKYEKQINISNVTSKENPFTKKGRYPS